MAKQKGITPFVGTLGGINFYYLKGKPVARKAGGGFNSKAIKSKGSMQRVRENASEFAHCSQVNKVFRQALRPFYQGVKFSSFHSYLMRLFLGLKDLDGVHARGQRRVGSGVDTAEGTLLLQQFDYTPACDITTVLPFKFVYDASNYTLTILDFNISKVAFLPGATHVELLYGVLDFNFETLDYDLHLASSLVLDRNYSGGGLYLEPSTLPTGIGTCLAVTGVRFYQEVDGELYMLKDQTGVGLVVGC
ncbi:hypothetical protein [Snuella lapsa]|uniref:Uncharacterized protein n=1 Tax=Snuella lapsa TaxID=870481 RepID=A0ABP6X0B0_9FLAO